MPLARRSAFDRLQDARHRKGAGFVVLLDPDKLDGREAAARVARCTAADVDAFFVGGSLMHLHELDRFVAEVKAATDRPVIGFPGSLNQLSPALDAVLYLSVVSGRNPEYLIGQHVHAAPMIRQMGLEAIPTAYLLVESGRPTTAQYMSGSAPIPRHKPEIAAATALAAELMGMRLVFTDAGSGAEHPVSEAIIAAITEVCTAPLVVGGGLRTPDEVARRVAAGAAFVVVGNAVEERAADRHYVAELAEAAHALAAHPLSRA